MASSRLSSRWRDGCPTTGTPRTRQKGDAPYATLLHAPRGDPEMHRPERSHLDRPFRDPHPRSCPPRVHAPYPEEHSPYPPRQYPIPDTPNVEAPPSPGDPVSLVTRREVLILATGTLLLPASAAALRNELFGEDD